MTVQEAIKTIKTYYCDECEWQGCEHCSHGVAIKALEKQIPKKPLYSEEFLDLQCPTCRELLTDRIPFKNHTFYFHCLNCGQKFDWGGEQE